MACYPGTGPRKSARSKKEKCCFYLDLRALSDVEKILRKKSFLLPSSFFLKAENVSRDISPGSGTHGFPGSPLGAGHATMKLRKIRSVGDSYPFVEIFAVAPAPSSDNGAPRKASARRRLPAHGQKRAATGPISFLGHTTTTIHLRNPRVARPPVPPTSPPRGRP